MSRNTAFCFLTVILLSAAALRVIHLDQRTFWFDESFSYTLVERFSLPEIVLRTGEDVHPPLYYVLLWSWTSVFGTSIVAMRGLSVLLGLGTIVGTYLMIRDAFLQPHAPEAISDPTTLASQRDTAGDDARFAGVLAAALVAVTAAQISWSNEARMYALGTCLAVFGGWFLVKAINNSTHPIRWWTAFALASTAQMYTHNFLLFTVASQFCFIAAYYVLKSGGAWKQLWSDRGARWAMASVVTAVLLYLPWFPVLLAQKARVQADYWIGQSSLWSVCQAWTLLMIPANWYTVEGYLEPLAVAGLLAVLGGALLYKGRRNEWLLFASAAGPVCLAYLVSLRSVTAIVDRQFLFAQVFVLCAVAVVATKFLRGYERWVIGAILVGTSLLISESYRRELDIPNRPGIAGATEHVLQNRQPDEPVLVLHPCIYFSVRYYAGDRATPKLFAKRSQVRHYTGGPILVDDDLMDNAQLESLSCDRVWVLDTTGYVPGTDRSSLPFEWTRSGTPQSFEDVFFFQGQVTVTRYERQRRQVAK